MISAILESVCSFVFLVIFCVVLFVCVESCIAEANDYFLIYADSQCVEEDNFVLQNLEVMAAICMELAASSL